MFHLKVFLGTKTVIFTIVCYICQNFSGLTHEVRKKCIVKNYSGKVSSKEDSGHVHADLITVLEKFCSSPRNIFYRRQKMNLKVWFMKNFSCKIFLPAIRMSFLKSLRFFSQFVKNFPIEIEINWKYFFSRQFFQLNSFGRVVDRYG